MYFYIEEKPVLWAFIHCKGCIQVIVLRGTNFKKTQVMKKHLLLFFALMITFHLQAQVCDSINDHRIEGHSLWPDFAIPLEDGTILCHARYFIHPYYGVYYDDDYKTKFYKIARHGAMILDSLTMEDDGFDDILMARIHDEGNPIYDTYCNVLAKVLIDDENCKSDLKLTFFDDNLQFNEAMEVTVPLADTIVEHYTDNVTHCLLDSYNDIIFQYMIPSRREIHFDRFGLDGTLKHKTIIPMSVIPVNYDAFVYNNKLTVFGLRQCCESPLKYNLYGCYGFNFGELWQWEYGFMIYELDSLFNIVNTLMLEPNDPNVYPYIHSCTESNNMVGLDDGSFLVARHIRWEKDYQSPGIIKYDANGNVLKETWLDATEVYYDDDGKPWDTYSGQDLKKDGKGNVYYSLEGTVDNVNMIIVAKYDENLNLIWVRYGMGITSPIPFHRVACRNELILLGNGVVMACGYNHAYQNTGINPNFGMWLMIVSDEGLGVSETENGIRPYLIYPNPVVDKLNVHYSPDVKPVKVELLDLQGRLIGSQKGNLESIDMQNLPTGTYTINMTLDNGKTYSDKIVKQ